MEIWKPFAGECLQYVKEPSNKVDKNVVAMVGTNTHYKEKMVSHVQQRSPWLYLCFNPCTIAL